MVYEARQVRAGRTVALKMISATAVSGLGTRQRFRVEAEAAAKLDHPHIVTIHDVGRSGARPSIPCGWCRAPTWPSAWRKGLCLPARRWT